MGLAKINDLYFDRRSSEKDRGQSLLNSQQQQHYVRGVDRERITSARQAAEALFTEQPVPDSVPPAEPSARKSRVLRALQPAPIRREQGEAPANSEQQMTTEIPSSHFARIRAWVEYV